jgi:cellulose synthase/poly-beta-1,6-N-acetylglucosamine synthase-like glycosyltransferase
VVKTVESLLDLNYPKDKLFVVVIDDGSTDDTWNVIQQFKDNPQVRLFHKENEGSKYAVLNFGLDQIHTDIVGCLDADSRVDAQALMHSILPFSDSETMCVIPSMVIDQPKTFMQHMQKPEYEVGSFLRKTLSSLNSLYIAPGPFSLFRRSVFDKIGYYIEAHHTEDLEIALRMQVNGMKLVYAPKSLVYTHGPKTWPALLKQRIRWTYGGMKNILSDYRHMMFRKRFGNLGAFVLPFSQITTVIAIISFPIMIWGLGRGIYNFAIQLFARGFSFKAPTLDIFFVSSKSYVFISILLLCITFLIVYISRRSILRTRLLSFDLLTFFVYPFFASWWMIRSGFNFITSKKSSWR